MTTFQELDCYLQEIAEVDIPPITSGPLCSPDNTDLTTSSSDINSLDSDIDIKPLVPFIGPESKELIPAGNKLLINSSLCKIHIILNK